MDRGDEWTKVTSEQRRRLDRGGEWTEVVSGQR